MGRPKGSKNHVEPLKFKTPKQIRMYKKTSDRNHGWLPCPFTYEQLDCCDYIDCQVLPGDGKYDSFIVFGTKKVSTEIALQNVGLSFQSEPELLLKFIDKYPERGDDLKRYIPDYVSNGKKRIAMPPPPTDYGLGNLTKEELTAIMRDDPRCELDIRYATAVNAALKKIANGDGNDQV